MKIAVLIARILLGLLFFVIGLNQILHFIKLEAPGGDAAIYMQLLSTHGIMTFLGVLMIVAGLLLLVGRYVPIALTILGPIVVNILLFHFLIAHGGAGMGLLSLALELFLIWAYRFSFQALFQAEPKPATSTL